MKSIEEIIAQAQTPSDITKEMSQRAVENGIREKIESLKLPHDHDGEMVGNYSEAAQQGCPHIKGAFDKFRHGFKAAVSDVLTTESLAKFTELIILQGAMPSPTQEAIRETFINTLHRLSSTFLKKIVAKNGQKPSKDRIEHAEIIQEGLELLKKHPELAYSLLILMEIINQYMCECMVIIKPESNLTEEQIFNYQSIFETWIGQPNLVGVVYYELIKKLTNNHAGTGIYQLSKEDCSDTVTSILQNKGFNVTIRSDYGARQEFRCPVAGLLSSALGKSGIFHLIYQQVCLGKNDEQFKAFKKYVNPLTNFEYAVCVEQMHAHIKKAME